MSYHPYKRHWDLPATLNPFNNVNSSLLATLAKRRDQTGAKLPEPPAHQNLQFVREMLSALASIQSYLSGSSVQLAAEWVRWIPNAIRMTLAGQHLDTTHKGASPKDKWRHRHRTFDPGQVVMADLGIGVHVEASYPHPCLVIYDNDQNLVLVVPITHNYTVGGRLPRLSILSTVGGDCGLYRVEHLRAISKQRILGVMDSAPREEFDQVQAMILANFLSSAHGQLQQLEADLKVKEMRIQELKTALEAEQAELRALRELVKPAKEIATTDEA